MARANLSSLADRDVTPLPPSEATDEPKPAASPATGTKRRGSAGEGTAAEEEALGVDVPVVLKRELKSTAGIRGEKMKHIVARAIRRELDRMNEDQ